jgi:tungstate transport system ATP-binding protein
MQQAKTSRKGKTLVGPVDLTLSGHGITIVMGPNGAGKTSLLRLIHGTARLTGGTIKWACPLEIARQHQSFVFQRPVMMRRSVIDNIAFPLLTRGVKKNQARQQALDWAKRIGLDRIADRSATALSGGEQQKLALARALIIKPQVLFLDEPSASLDEQAKREIEDLLKQERDNGTRIVMSTHDIGQGRRLADDVLFLLQGQIHEKSAAKAFFNEPQTPQAQAFLNGDIIE